MGMKTHHAHVMRQKQFYNGNVYFGVLY